MEHVYRAFSYFGLASVFGSLLYGFRYDSAAPWRNYFANILVYGAWAAVHLVMTRGWFKKAVYGARAATIIERQVYITVTVTTWLAVLWYHQPLPGGSLALSGTIRFAANVCFLLCILSFFEGATFTALDGLLGVPGSAMVYSHGAETPLFTEGQYAKVRHPMYRAAIFAGLCSMVIHPNTAQLLWVLMIGATFIGFIPIEERQLTEARGDAYPTYMQKTPWRLFRGVW